MNTVTARPPDLRVALRRPGDALARAPIGTVPILWINTGITEATTILDEIARVGYDGTQLGAGFPEGDQLRDELAARGLRLAEVYLPIEATVDGPRADAMDVALERLRLLHDAGGDVLCAAIDGTPERDATAGNADARGTPVLTDAGWAALVELLHDIADAAAALGHPTAFHPHAGTFVETPAEVDRLVASSDPARIWICLDVGHHIVGGGDPVAAVRALGDRVQHVHLKDVDPSVLAELRAGRFTGLGHAVRQGLFTELGAGALDLDGVLELLAERDYAGWLIVEQDNGWGPPSESAAIGRRVLATALHRLGSTRAAGGTA